MKRYLIIPSFPTPNGRLHLGHIVGPYVRADILHRFVKRNGSSSRLIGGFDSYEQYVVKQAFQENRQVRDVVANYQIQILRDLQAIGIDYDLWIDPLSAEHERPFADAQMRLLASLQASQRFRDDDEQLLYSGSKAVYGIGPWLRGNCPVCKASMAGAICENCGQYVEPSDIRNASLLPELGQSIHRTIRTSYLHFEADQLASLLPRSQQIAGPSHLRTIPQRMLSQSFLRLRLTVPSPFGIPVDGPAMLSGESASDDTRNQNRLFSYAFLLGYFLYIGEQYCAIENQTLNPFTLGSDVETASTFGFDGIATRTVSMPAIASCLAGVRLCSRLIPNYFCNLNGKKFSTSRRHAIWTEEFVAHGISPDAVRWFLCKISPSTGETDFQISEFLSFFNRDWIEAVQSIASAQNALLGSRESIPALSDGIWQSAQTHIQLQRDSLEGEIFSPERAIQTLESWLARAQISIESGQSYWWLKAWAALSYPFLPFQSQDIWKQLGELRVPVVGESFHRIRTPAPSMLPIPQPLTFQEIASLVPAESS